MALLKLGGFATEISGKIGGSIFGTSANGSYMKSNSYSQQPNTPLQSIQRNKIGLITQAWRSLTAAQKTSYQNEVINYPYVNRVGDTAYYTAYQLFCKLNLNRQVLGLSILTTAPTFTAVSNPVTFPSQSVLDELLQTYNSGVIGNTLSIWGAPIQNEFITPKLSKFRLLKTHLLTATSGDIDIFSEYQQLFGSLNTGDIVYTTVKTYDTSSGNVTNFDAPEVLEWI